jgi:hypothetical protein
MDNEEKIIEKSTKFALYTSFYNAEQYVYPLYENIKKLDYDNWTWFVCDDFSSDSTLEKILEISEKNEKIVVVKQSKKKEFFWQTNKFIPEEFDFIVTVENDDTIAFNALTVYDHVIRKNPDTVILTSDFHKTKEIDGSLHSISLIISDKELLHRIERFHPEIDYLNNYNYHPFGHLRCYKNIKGMEFPIKDFNDIIDDSYKIMFMSGMGKWIHVPRNLYIWNLREKSASHNNYNPAFNNNFDDAYKKMQENVFDPSYEYFSIFPELNSLIGFPINSLSNKKISLITRRIMSKPEIEKIKELYFDCNISINSIENFDFLSMVLNYYEEKESLNEILRKIKLEKNDANVIFYYFNSNFHSDDKNLNSFMDEKLNFFNTQISNHFSEYRFFRYFRHIFFYL